MYPVVIALKAVAEMVMLLYLAQAMVRLLSFGRHERNAVYLGLRFLTSPVTRVGRWLSPRAVLDRHAAMVGFVLTCWIWVGLVLAKAQLLPGPGS